MMFEALMHFAESSGLDLDWAATYGVCLLYGIIGGVAFISVACVDAGVFLYFAIKKFIRSKRQTITPPDDG